MSAETSRRARKRLATRESISDVATRLFFERGFDRVTIDEIAAAADVGRMTVFNYFPRKEDLFFDRDEEVRQTLRDAIWQRGPDVSPVEATRLLVHRLAAQGSPYIEFSAVSQGWIETIEHSETLKARARAIRDELARFLAENLSECAGQGSADPVAHLAANLLLATWTVAYVQAYQNFCRSRDAEQAKAILLTLVNRGTTGLKAAMADTPYA